MSFVHQTYLSSDVVHIINQQNTIVPTPHWAAGFAGFNTSNRLYSFVLVIIAGKLQRYIFRVSIQRHQCNFLWCIDGRSKLYFPFSQ